MRLSFIVDSSHTRYPMKCRLLFGLSVWLSAICSSLGSDVVINEIMYRPSSERVQEEYIELYNRGTNTISLLGWRLSKGVSFQITNNVQLGPGQFLAIAADRTAFLAKYPSVANVIGGWTGSLRNSGEEIELENDLGENEDSVVYSTEGDWGIRQRGPSVNGHSGWEWFAEHDGLGKSVELVNARISNNSGQNWRASVAFQGTPGGPNSVTATDTAPIITETQHSPPVPKSSEAVTVTAQIEDEPGSTITATLFHRVAITDVLPAFSTNTMFDDGLHNDGLAGDSIYGVILPEQFSGTVIEFYVEARDGGGHTRSWPSAARQANGTFGAARSHRTGAGRAHLGNHSSDRRGDEYDIHSPRRCGSGDPLQRRRAHPRCGQP